MDGYATPEQTSRWLRTRMDELGITSLEQLAELTTIDKGNLSRIFRQLQRPRVESLEPLASGLGISIYELLIRIGAMDPRRAHIHLARQQPDSEAFAWPEAV